MIINSYQTDLSQDINHPLHNYYILKAIFKFFSNMYMKCKDKVQRTGGVGVGGGGGGGAFH